MSNLKPYHHVSFLPDGNGRWAQQHGLPRTSGHTAGAANFISLLPHLSKLPIDNLSVYMFSTENWGRPASEISHIFHIVENGIIKSMPLLLENNIRFQHIGELTGLPRTLQRALLTACEVTQLNDGLVLIIAINYGGRYEIVQAVRNILLEGTSAAPVNENDIRKHLYMPKVPDPEIILRTGGNQRLSNWMVWQTADTLVKVVPVLWPDLTPNEIYKVLWDKLELLEKRILTEQAA